MKINLGGCLFLALLLSSACEIDTSKPPEPLHVEPKEVSFSYQISSKGDTATYHSLLRYKTENDTLNYNRKDIAKIVFLFPQIDSFRQTAIKDSINTLIKRILLQEEAEDMAFESIDGRLDEFITGFLDFDAEMKDFGLPAGPKWVNELYITVLLNSPQWLCLKVYENEFTGGAHSNSSFRFFNLNLNTGKVINIEDLFVANYQPFLDSIAKIKFKAAVNLPQDSSIESTNFEFDSKGFSLPENFSIQAKAIGFHYNPYDMAPYSLGTINFKIPYAEIYPILNRNLIKLDSIPSEKKAAPIKEDISVIE